MHQTGAPNFIKELLLDLKLQIDSNRVIVNDINTPRSLMDRSTTQKLNKETLELNVIISQMDVTDTKHSV